MKFLEILSLPAYCLKKKALPLGWRKKQEHVPGTNPLLHEYIFLEYLLNKGLFLAFTAHSVYFWTFQNL